VRRRRREEHGGAEEAEGFGARDCPAYVEFHDFTLGGREEKVPCLT
jgi:hypothetical protein